MQVQISYNQASLITASPEMMQVNVVLVESDDDESVGRDPDVSCARDTSNVGRDVSMDNTRQTVNTQTSILDLTKDEEDDDESDVASVLFQDLHDTTPLRLIEDNEETEITQDAPEVQEKAQPSNSLLDHIFPRSDNFFDTLCRSPMSSTTCNNVSCTPTPMGCGNHASDDTVAEPTVQDGTLVTSEARYQLETDVWNLLSCSVPPNGLELEYLWNINLQGKVPSSQTIDQPSRPRRTSLKHRMSRIRRLRQERWSGATRHGLTISQEGSDSLASSRMLTQRSVSMDNHDHVLFNRIGQGIDPIFPRATTTRGHQTPGMSTDGYDSDPELSVPAISVPVSSLADIDENPSDVYEHEHTIFYQVQETLNTTWTLTWHPNPHNIQEFGISREPMCVNLWMERGMVISQTGLVVEPTFMWRDAYQPHLSQRKLNATSQKPWSMRLLSTCRIALCGRIDKKTYPLTRQDHCLVLKTCHGQEFVLEAQTSNQCRDICERWKLAVARFASLAVTEDIDAIANEFFHPTLSHQTLTLPNTPPPAVSTSSDCTNDPTY
eukprot:Nitzschia sp. Nitz4//scaffold49_size126201//53905//55629//NITZ4_003640-RA/size126201-augustus-gene-0.3-mRNA-1//1//CDS//3329553143//6729//frame0